MGYSEEEPGWGEEGPLGLRRAVSGRMEAWVRGAKARAALHGMAGPGVGTGLVCGAGSSAFPAWPPRG